MAIIGAGESRRTETNSFKSVRARLAPGCVYNARIPPVPLGVNWIASKAPLAAKPSSTNFEYG